MPEQPRGFVLVETLASKKQGKTVWFRFMTEIGPCATSDPAERFVFATEEAARACPALWHALSFYEIRPLEVEADA